MITIRLNDTSQQNLLALTFVLKKRMGMQLNPTNAARHAIDFTLRHLTDNPQPIYETKRCDDCGSPLLLRIVDGLDQVFCAKCDEGKQ